jgi:hypothetical protein
MPIFGISPNYYLVKLAIRKEKFEKNEKKEGKLKTPFYLCATRKKLTNQSGNFFF